MFWAQLLFLLFVVLIRTGNRNAGTTYLKAVNGLKDVEFEITADNAKKLDKGKTKVPGVGKVTYQFTLAGVWSFELSWHFLTVHDDELLGNRRKDSRADDHGED